MSTSVTSSRSGWRQRGASLKRGSRNRALARAQISRCNRELIELENQVAQLGKEMSAAVELLEKHQSRFASQDRRIETLDQTIWGILNGRVWRTLELIGRLPRKLLKRAT